MATAAGPPVDVVVEEAAVVTVSTLVVAGRAEPPAHAVSRTRNAPFAPLARLIRRRDNVRSDNGRKYTMKFLVSWTFRTAGSVADAEADAKRGLQLFSKWVPPEGLKMTEFVSRIDGRGGYVMVETDNPALLADGPSKFGVLNEFEVIPVMDIMDGMPIAQEAIEFRDSIS